MTELEDELKGLCVCMIESIKSTANLMPPPNDWTPRFMMIATTAESLMHRVLAKYSK